MLGGFSFTDLPLRYPHEPNSDHYKKSKGVYTMSTDSSESVEIDSFLYIQLLTVVATRGNG